MVTERADIAIIGGGITGIGIALEASHWGFDTVLIERGTFASQTSANSLRIFHGGLRYLQNLNFRRVLESASEQAYWLASAARFIAPLECVMPLESRGIRSALPVRCAGTMYGAVLRAIKSPLDPPRVLHAKAAEKLSPFLRDKVSAGALWWQDALLRDPEAFVQLLVDKMKAQGVSLRQSVAAERVTRVGNKWNVALSDGSEVQSTVVVNASAQSEAAFVPLDYRSHVTQLPKRWCHAINLEFDFPLESPIAVGLKSSTGRLFFSVPRGAHSAFGTWYYVAASEPEDSALNREIDVFLRELRSTFGDDRITTSHLARVDKGLLPMQKENAQGPVLFGRHQYFSKAGFIHVMATKYTTFRLVGQEVMQLARVHLKSN